MFLPFFRSLKSILFAICFSVYCHTLNATELTEEFESAGFVNHQELTTAGKLSLGNFDYLIQAGGSLKTVNSPAAIYPGFDPEKKVTRFTIRHRTGEAFAFRSFTGSDQFEMNSMVAVSGYRNNSQVTAAVTVSVPWPVAEVDFSSQPGFDNVDEIRFENTDLYFFLEEWKYTKKEEQIIQFNDPADRVYAPGGTFLTPATSTSGLTVTVSSNTTGICTVAGQTVTIINAGICSLTASQDGDANYHPAIPVNQSVVINKADQKISFTPPTEKTFNNPSFAISAVADSGLAVTFLTTTEQVCSLSGDTVTILAAGLCSIAADQSGNDNYNPALRVTASITINKAGQNISFSVPQIKLYGAPPFSLDASASSGLDVSFKTASSGICSINGSTVTILNVGICVITAFQEGDQNYNAAPEIAETVTIKINWDIDGDGKALPLTDGLLVIRYLFDFTGEALINSAVASDATRRTASAILDYLEKAKTSKLLDIDADTNAQPLTDGLLLLRYLFDFRGESLIANAVASGAGRSTVAQIEPYIAANMPE